MSDTPETDAHEERHETFRIGLIGADFARRLEREREQFKLEAWTERTERRMAEQTLKYVTQERNQLRTALEQIAEDCRAWLDSENDEPSAVFVKLVGQYAYDQSQAPLDHKEAAR